MQMVDVGRGTPVVLVPGIQGRWEWMKPAVDALAPRCRVITFSLADEPSSGARFDARRGFDNYVDQIDDALTAAGLTSAAICGVSYGGLIAAAFAARHPERVRSLIMVSAIPSDWQPDSRVRFYLRAPRLLSPLFCLASLRMYREIAAATPGVLPGVLAALRHGANVLTHMFSPSRMAARVRLLERAGARIDLTGHGTVLPTLIITGEAGLDRVVPVARTREYLKVWPHAEVATLANTGHIGLITRPGAFADLVVPFVETTSAPNLRQRIG
jgi:pimeloyl-ACP methyl ester carboxylesterase